jgi:hypothetical protein
MASTMDFLGFNVVRKARFLVWIVEIELKVPGCMATGSVRSNNSSSPKRNF